MTYMILCASVCLAIVALQTTECSENRKPRSWTEVIVTTAAASLKNDGGTQASLIMKRSDTWLRREVSCKYSG